MKAKLTVTDSSGAVFEAEVDLVPSALSARRRRRPSAPEQSGVPAPARDAASVDFSLPVRAFMNRYARGRSGPEAFTLLVARFAEGALGREVPVDLVRQEWSRMTGILGTSFATVYGTRAKNQAWVDSPRRGVFVLLPDWMGALGQEVSN